MPAASHLFIMQDSEEQIKLNFGIWYLKNYFFEDHAAGLFTSNLRSPSRNCLAVMKPEEPSSKQPACDVHKPSPCFTLVYFTPFRFNAHCQFTSLLSLWSLIFVLPPFGWLRSYANPFCLMRMKPATRIPLQPNHTETPTHIEPRTLRPMW